jgi:hypothetical protein
LDLSFYPLTLEALDQANAQANAEALCLFVGEDERPLVGLAGLCDWRLSGALSRMLRRGLVKGEEGEALLTPGLRLGFRKLFLFGMGPVGQAEDELALRLAERLRRLGRAGVEDAAFQIPAAPLARHRDPHADRRAQRPFARPRLRRRSGRDGPRPLQRSQPRRLGSAPRAPGHQDARVAQRAAAARTQRQPAAPRPARDPQGRAVAVCHSTAEASSPKNRRSNDRSQKSLPSQKWPPRRPRSMSRPRCSKKSRRSPPSASEPPEVDVPIAPPADPTPLPPRTAEPVPTTTQPTITKSAESVDPQSAPARSLPVDYKAPRFVPPEPKPGGGGKKNRKKKR